MRLYKLTDEYNRTHGGTEWAEGTTHEAKGAGFQMCTGDLLHAYTNPLLAVLGNPIHAVFAVYNMWLVEGDVAATDGFKVGCKKLTAIRQLKSIPRVTLRQRVRFAILCAMAVYKAEPFTMWAQGWLNGKDRSAHAAEAFAKPTPWVPVPLLPVTLAAQAAIQFANAAIWSTAAAAGHTAEIVARMRMADVKILPIAIEAMKKEVTNGLE